MRLRFAVSGHAPKVEAKDPAPKTKETAAETAERVDATNDETKIGAASGG